jgi:tetratricopeptide (TPR) repeat protein
VGKLVSAAMIVKNEARFLAGCLDSIAGLVDEIVVVDTGSTDRSPDIAAAHGARVQHHTWHDDFSAARNQALDQAVGDWILYIDADERVRPYERSRLEQDLGAASLCATTVRFHPRTGYTAYPEHRLFRRDPRIRFRGAIHETMMPDINQMVATGQGRVGSSNLTIDHLGYDGDQSHKLQRNLTILEKEVQVKPERMFLWWHLGTVYRDLGRMQDAAAAWQTGVGIARRVRPSPAEASLCFVELVRQRLASGLDVMDLLNEAIALQPEDPFLQWLMTQALQAAGRYEDALPIYEHLATIDPETLLTHTAYDRRVLGAGALAEAGQWAFRIGRWQDSAAFFRRAEWRCPDKLEFRVKRQLAEARITAAEDVSA